MKKKTKKKEKVYTFDKNGKIIEEIYVMIFEHLEVIEMYRVSQVCKRWSKIMFDYNVFERNS